MHWLLRAVMVAAATLAGSRLCAAATQDPSPEVLSAWSEVVNNQLVTAPSAVGSTTGTRILAAVHMAQYQAVEQVLRARGLTLKTARPYKIKAYRLQNALVNAVAAAAKAVLLGINGTAGIYPTVVAGPVNALYAAQTVNPDAAAIEIGEQQGLAMLLYRANDGTSPNIVTYFGNNGTNGAWRSTSFVAGNPVPGRNPQWATSRPWAIQYPSQFRAPPPPPLGSSEYRRDYLEVKDVGSNTSTTRTAVQSNTAIFWSGNIEYYFNQAVRQAVAKRSFIEALRFFAVTAIAGADAFVANWDTKYFYSAWRPVSSIPLGNGVGFPADPAWTSFLNTPSFPEYVSAHTTAGAAYAEALWLLTGKDKAAFSISSYTLPSEIRTYSSYFVANLENAVSRIYGGVHYRFANVFAGPQGIDVARVAYQFIYGTEAKLASQRKSSKLLGLYKTYV